MQNPARVREKREQLRIDPKDESRGRNDEILGGFQRLWNEVFGSSELEKSFLKRKVSTSPEKKRFKN